MVFFVADHDHEWSFTRSKIERDGIGRKTITNCVIKAGTICYADKSSIRSII